MLGGNFRAIATLAMSLYNEIRIHTHEPEAPEGWRHFFEQALALDVKWRPMSALQLVSDFEQSIQIHNQAGYFA
jgi:hypothetical protein